VVRAASHKYRGVTVLCADCHRMIHRKRPALSLQELRETIAKTGD
jgi:predicted HNH restriction endonuclease